MKFTKKIISSVLILTLILLPLTGCSLETNSQNTDSITQSKELKVHYINVGQGDSILVQVNGKSLLIDAGPESNKDDLLKYLAKQNIKKLDYVVVTHPHEDHIGGMKEIIERYKIGQFYAPKVTQDTKVFENMIKALSDKNLKINVAKANITLDLGDNVKCEMLSPINTKYESINNYSAVIMLKYGSSKFLFMGDAEALSEKEILQSGADVSCDVLKIGHHGSSTSSSKAFLDKANPKIAVISCGKDNDYGHPNKVTLQELKKRNIKVYRTDINNTILLKSDGTDIKY